MRSLTTFIVGFIFAIGLGVGGMTLPERVVSFLDIFGEWNPSLLFVMGGALLVHSFAYRWIVRQPSPLLAEKFDIPRRKDISFRLVMGAAFFGLGWGLVGYCPAPAIVALATLRSEPILFVVSMLVGMFAFRRWESSSNL
jgi:uncharacterized membrane protein YedE/YeeE